jgi:hypothetical protein
MLLSTMFESMPLLLDSPSLASRGRCQRLTLTEGALREMVRHTPSVADYRATSPASGGGKEP